MIRVKRAYAAPEPDDGLRFLVDRLWPRGVKKENLPLDGWLKELAPSTALRQWFGHDPEKWPEFNQRYAAELTDKAELWQPLLEAAQKGTVTLLFGAHDEAHNNAVALRTFLEARIDTAAGL